MTGSALKANRRAVPLKAAPARALGCLTLWVHLLTEALFGLLFAKDDPAGSGERS
ncbi:MAG: hypothetical protein ACRDRL_31840 [Sciscionella sp.]